MRAPGWVREQAETVAVRLIESLLAARQPLLVGGGILQVDAATKEVRARRAPAVGHAGDAAAQLFRHSWLAITRNRVAPDVAGSDGVGKRQSLEFSIDASDALHWHLYRYAIQVDR